MSIAEKIAGQMSAVRWVLLALELLLAAWFIAAVPFVNAGTVVGLAACAAFMAVTVGWSSFKGLLKKLWAANDL